MSRLDKIKARADAATKGPWLQDGPWWTDDGGPEPTALPCVVDVDRALVVFPPDATDVGMKRPEDRAANMAFIAAAREDVPWLIERIGELNGAICWDTTCLNCSSLLDSNYDQYVRAEIAAAEVARLTAERDALQVGRDRDRVKGATAVLNEELRTSEQKTRAERAEAEVERLTAELAEVKRTYTPCDLDLLTERDALAAQVARVEALAEDWRYKGQFGWGPWQIGEGPDPEGYVMDHCASALRAALSGSGADTTDTQPTDQEVSDE